MLIIGIPALCVLLLVVYLAGLASLPAWRWWRRRR
jgi:hypothetical protein